MIKIQKKDFIIDDEILKIKSNYSNIGGVSIFIGFVRNINLKKDVKSLDIEVYNDMAIKQIEKICSEAKKKWSLIDYLVIHRFGTLSLDEKIVLVATFAEHRKNSFESCNYIMDFLKKDAPFWKKEYYNGMSNWL